MVPGRDYVMVNGKLRQVTPSELVAHLSKEQKSRSRYRRLKRRGTRVREAWIKGKSSPLVELTVTLAPWESDFMAEGAAVAPEKVADVLFQLGSRLVPEIEMATGCRVIAMTWHTDASGPGPHVNFQLSRVNPDESGTMRLTGHRGFGLAGPWMTAVSRQRAVSLRYEPHDAKYERALNRWCARYPGRELPLDIRLAGLIDALVEKLFGPLLDFKNAYRVRIEGDRATAINGKAQALRDELSRLQEVSPQRSQPEITR
jgi:hypothetical protein